MVNEKMRRIVILGAAESGVGAAALAKVKGFDVFVSDMGKIKENYKQVLREYDVPWEEGRHTEELILNASEVIKSPGIPEDAPMVKKVKDAGIPVISEIEFAGRYTDAKMGNKRGLKWRVFKRAPLHDTFRVKPGQLPADFKVLINWPKGCWLESKITVRFWIVTIIMAALAIVTLKIR